ncbi:MAG: hypothetical protein KME21_13820 [Desmonostoc vinosum HA7617-LM4]|jgi:hypothetical protein|nr:hypothetical protein [Desmonostoc vinosum HA7617-LM4]
MSNDSNKYIRKYKQLFTPPISLLKVSKNSDFYPSKILLGTFLAVSFNMAAVACPEQNIERQDFSKATTKILVETSDGKKFSCWSEFLKSPGFKFQGSRYDVAIHCHKSLTIYSHLDEIYEVIVDDGGDKSEYKADFLGDKYECNAQGETMIKSWIYKRGANVIKQMGYSYTPYKW